MLIIRNLHNSVHTDGEHGWKELSSYQYHPDVGSSVTLSLTGSTNTDSADVAVNHTTSPSLAPGSLLFAVSFSDPGTKQPSLHEALARFVFTLSARSLCSFVLGDLKSNQI